MQVQNISMAQNVNPNFNGKINLLPGNLGYNPARNVRKVYDKLQALIEDKPFDLLIKQQYKTQDVWVIAQKPEDFGKKNAPKYEVLIPGAVDMDDNYRLYKYTASDLIVEAAKVAVRAYENSCAQQAVNKPKKGLFAYIAQKLTEYITGKNNV